MDPPIRFSKYDVESHWSTVHKTTNPPGRDFFRFEIDRRVGIPVSDDPKTPESLVPNIKKMMNRAMSPAQLVPGPGFYGSADVLLGEFNGIL